MQDRFRAEAQAAWETKHITSSGSEGKRRLEEVCRHELRMENIALLKHRKQKMKDLYESEAIEWDVKLAEQGIAIALD